MSPRSFLRDLVLLAAAACIGWWAHSANNPVHADSSTDDVSVQLGSAAGHGTIGVYSPALRTVFFYPIDSGDSHIGCMYAISITRAGAPVDRVNCPNVSITGR